MSKKIINPYRRIKEIDARLEPLEIKEKELNRMSWKRKPQLLEKIEFDIFFLVMERNNIKNTIDYFEKQNKKMQK